MLVRPERQTPLTRMVSALMVEVTKETMNTSITAFSPCWTGSRLLRGAVGHGGGAVAGLVRVDAAGEAVAHGDHHADARRAAGHGADRERLAHDQGEHRRESARRA